jgi:hypothetical protein
MAAPCSCHGCWLLLLLVAAGALGAEGASLAIVQLDVESLLPSAAAASCPTTEGWFALLITDWAMHACVFLLHLIFSCMEYVFFPFT